MYCVLDFDTGHLLVRGLPAPVYKPVYRRQKNEVTAIVAASAGTGTLKCTYSENGDFKVGGYYNPVLQNPDPSWTVIYRKPLRPEDILFADKEIDADLRREIRPDWQNRAIRAGMFPCYSGRTKPGLGRPSHEWSMCRPGRADPRVTKPSGPRKVGPVKKSN